MHIGTVLYMYVVYIYDIHTYWFIIFCARCNWQAAI